MSQEAEGLPQFSDALLIKVWRDYARSLETTVRLGRPTEMIARRLGYLEREMERRGIRHDDPEGDVLDSHETWHGPLPTSNGTDL